MKTEIWKENPEVIFSLNIPDNYERYFVPVIGKPLAEDLIRKAALEPGEKVLDVACGTGIIARLAFDKVGPDGAVTGLDINPGMLHVARSINSQGKQIEWIESGVENMPLDNELYDVVICQLGLQFFEDKKAALHEMRRVLVPGGRILVSLPGPSTLLVKLQESIRDHVDPQAAALVGTIFSLHDPAEIKTLFNGAGFQHINIEIKKKTLNLPAPEDFLWQYVNGTPLAVLFSKLGKEVKKALEKTIVTEWQQLTVEERIICEQPIVEIASNK